MYRKFFGPLAAVAVMSLSTTAGADTIKPTGFVNGSASVATTNTGSPPNSTANAGAFNVDNITAGSSFIAWCMDLYSTISFGTSYTYSALTGPFTGTLADPSAGANPNPYSGTNGPVLTNSQLASIENLFEVNALAVEDIYTGALGSDHSAGFQLALWELIYETGSGYGLGTGTFGSTTGSINTIADAYLGNLGNTIQQNYDLTYWESGSSNGTTQNLVSIAAVPVPAAGLLLLAGLAGLGFTARRRRKS